jgi:hypothetical protein
LIYNFATADRTIYIVDGDENVHMLRNFMTNFIPWLHDGKFSTARLTYSEDFGKNSYALQHLDFKQMPIF